MRWIKGSWSVWWLRFFLKKSSTRPGPDFDCVFLFSLLVSSAEGEVIG